jgi:hypothetical protein
MVSIPRGQATNGWKACRKDMSPVLMAFMAVVLLALAAYAQYSIPAHTLAGRVMLTRVVLAAIGVAFGFVMALGYPQEPGLGLLAFLVGFGMVHFPAALILFFKHFRGEGRS